MHKSGGRLVDITGSTLPVVELRAILEGPDWLGWSEFGFIPPVGLQKGSPSFALEWKPRRLLTGMWRAFRRPALDKQVRCQRFLRRPKERTTCALVLTPEFMGCILFGKTISVVNSKFWLFPIHSRSESLLVARMLGPVGLPTRCF